MDDSQLKGECPLDKKCDECKWYVSCVSFNDKGERIKENKCIMFFNTQLLTAILNIVAIESSPEGKIIKPNFGGKLK